ncbi:MAG TPA: MFS transporter [Nitrososphaerales archaeon]|nr:MFS transporter [Nitrososphaerales archaeon]
MFSRDIALILASRAVRTFPLGIAGVLLPVYLASIGSSLFVGLFYSLSAASTLVTLGLLGAYGHRVRVRDVLIVQTLFLSTALSIMALSPFSLLFLLAAAISITNWAPGGGSGTGGGAYNTSVNILLSEHSESGSRTLALSLSSLIGAVSFSVGAYFLSVVDIPKSMMVLNPVTSGPNLQSPATLFAVCAVTQFIAAIVLSFVRRTPKETTPTPGGTTDSTTGRRSIFGVFRRASFLVVAEFANGLGMGLFSQIAPLWFYLRFNLSLGTVGLIFASVGLLTAFVVVISPRVESKLGQSNAIFLARTGAGLLLVATAFAPTLTTALIPYFVSTSLARLVSPVQQSFVFTRIARSEWTNAASIIATANVVGAAVGPLVGAILLLDVNLALPFVLAFPLILVSALLYRREPGPSRAAS